MFAQLNNASGCNESQVPTVVRLLLSSGQEDYEKVQAIIQGAENLWEQLYVEFTNCRLQSTMKKEEWRCSYGKMVFKYPN